MDSAGGQSEVVRNVDGDSDSERTSTEMLNMRDKVPVCVCVCVCMLDCAHTLQQLLCIIHSISVSMFLYV